MRRASGCNYIQLLVLFLHLLIALALFPKLSSGVQAKVKALSMYRGGVMRPYPHPRSEAYITGLAAYRGSQFQLDYESVRGCVAQVLI